MVGEILGKTPVIADDCFIADTASIYGDVKIEKGGSVWFGAAIRGDSDSVSIGENSNVQENVVIHVDPGFPAKIGNNVTVGHSAIVHGATIKDNVIVGMGSIIMDGAVIGENCIIGAGALITQNTIIPDGSVVVGAPGKVIKEAAEMNKKGALMSAEEYTKLAKEFKKQAEKK